MIKEVIDMLNAQDWHVGDPDIDFAKGANKIPYTFSEAKQLIKRKINGARYKNRHRP